MSLTNPFLVIALRNANRREQQWWRTGEATAQDCSSKPKHEEAHMTQGEEDDGPALFFASASVNVEATPAPAIVHLMEKKVVPQLDSDGERDMGLWYLDTGATNQMMGAREVFTELDTGAQGTVRFGDGSVVAIQGCGSILFEAKNGEHQCPSKVYYILRLTANIASLGQLDEGGCKVFINDGVLQIWVQWRRLVARVSRSPGRLYLLRMMVAKPVSPCTSRGQGMMLAREVRAPPLRCVAEASAGRHGARPTRHRARRAAVRVLHGNEAVARLVPGGGQVPGTVVAGPSPRQPLRAHHAGDTWRPATLHVACRRPLMVHVGEAAEVQGRGAGGNQAVASPGRGGDG